jgi:tetratricopeptide (TPR) repeat protein
MLMTNLASVLDYQGKYAEVEAVLREVTALAREYSAHDERFARLLVNGLGRFLIEQERFGEAEPQLREGLELYQRHLPPNHVWTSEARGLLGTCLGNLGRFEEAEGLLIQSYEALRAAGDSEKRRTEDALERLVDLYDVWGRGAQAETYRSQLAGMRAP